MNNSLQPLLYIGVPSILILAGMFFNWSMANGLRAEFKDLRAEVRGDIKDLRSEFKDLRNEVRADLGSIRAQLDDVKDSNHKDALEIMRQMTALHERVAIVESRQK